MSLSKEFLMLALLVYLASPDTEIRAKKFIRIDVKEDSWVSMEIASKQSHGSLNRLVI